jgi:DNA invertase Pin-like site-specific DNA recombinase
MEQDMARHRGKYISYLRVSTSKQEQSGLGLEAQRAAVETYLNGGNWEIVEEVVEIESGKSHRNRPELARALDACRRYGARLVISRLDRLSRDPVFLLSLRDAGIDFVAVDLPQANRLTVGIMALVAEQEREAISQRTKAALAAVKARGVKLGNPKPETARFLVRKLYRYVIENAVDQGVKLPALSDSVQKGQAKTKAGKARREKPRKEDNFFIKLPQNGFDHGVHSVKL